MWLKVHNATSFYAAILSIPDEDKGWFERVIREARSLGVNIRPPDVNLSGMEFTVIGDDILYGLLAIKGVGDATVYSILDNRPFEGYADFCQKTNQAAAGVALARAGAFESLDGREFLLSIVRKGEKPLTILRYECGEEVKCRSQAAIDKSLCPTHGEACAERNRREHWEMWTVADHINHNRKLKNPRPLPAERTLPTIRELMDSEKEMLGVLISVEPSIEKHWAVVKDFVDTQADFEQMGEDDDVQVAGEIVGVKPIKTKKGQPMAFIDLARGPDVFSCTCFTGEYLRYAEVLEDADSIIVKGRKNIYNDRASIIVDRLQHLEDFVKGI
jgi:DNA polymerase-3 subunit alpha